MADACGFFILREADAMGFAQVVDRGLGAQAIHLHTLEEIVGDRLVHIDPDGVFGVTGQSLGQDFALR
jgi:hypothetical protein